MKKQTVIIILFVVLAALLLIYFFSGKGEKKQYSWKESYKADSDQPYGTIFIRKLLEHYRPGEKFILNDKTPLHELLAKDTAASDIPADYIYIGDQLYLTPEDKDALLAFIYAGNDAFIATRYLPFNLIDSVFIPECEQEIFLSEYMMPAATFNFYHTSLRKPKGYTYAYREGSQKKNYAWMALQPALFCDSLTSVVPLGHFNDRSVNFFRLSFGYGNLYIHTNPIAFTNYFMRTPDKAEYAANVLSHLRGRTIIWDEFSRSKFAPPPERQTNPLAYILQHRSLKYAWWMMLASAILYTVFTAKRRQRIIPVREEKVNTSLEYVKMISALHFENANHRDIAVKKMKHFLYFIRAKYGIYGHQLTEEHFKRLAEKSQVERKHIDFIFEEYARIENNRYGTAGAHQLMTLYNAIDHFYKHCK